MAQRTPGGTPSRGGTGARTGTSRRVSTAPVKKPFPWGFAAGALVLAVFLVGILVYAATNTGSGFKTAADKLDATFKGLQVTKNLSFNHVSTRVAYPDEKTEAPDGGNHNAIWQAPGVYTAAIVPEHAVHSLEHGAVWITYAPGLPADQVKTLAALVEGNDYRLMSPYPGQTSPIALQAWGRRLDVKSASDPQVKKFVDGYTNGPQTREAGAVLTGGVDQPGTVPFVQGADGKFVPGTATGSVPAEGPVPSGEPGSAAPGSAPSAVPTP